MPKTLANCTNISQLDKAYPTTDQGNPVNIHEIIHSVNTHMKQNKKWKNLLSRICQEIKAIIEVKIAIKAGRPKRAKGIAHQNWSIKTPRAKLIQYKLDK